MGPPPPRKNNAGKVIGIIAGVLVAVFVLARVVTEVVNPDTPSGSGGTAYQVSLPKSLEGGKLTLAKDMSDQANTQNPDLGPGDKGYMGHYRAASGMDQVLFNGLNSDKADEDTADHILDGMEKNPGSEAAVPRRDITPNGSKSPLTCEVVTKPQAGRKLSMPVCSWGDPGSGGAVIDASPRSMLKEPDAIDLTSFADRVAVMRDEIRKPAS